MAKKYVGNEGLTKLIQLIGADIKELETTVEGLNTTLAGKEDIINEITDEEVQSAWETVNAPLES